MFRNKLLAATIAAAMAGCAPPILRVGGAGYDPLASPAVRHEPTTMAEAHQKLNHFHAAYYEGIRSQQETNQNATTGLVWLGATVLGMATGSVHKDAVLGTSLIGGTTYTLARAQLDSRRIDVWQEGMEALDCARDASLPLELSDERRAEILEARARVRTSVESTRSAIEEVRRQLKVFANDNLPQAPLAQQAIARATTALSDAEAARTAGLALVDASRGRELSTAVDRISAAVTKASGSLAMDISAVKQMVAGIGGFAAIFAPGIDSSFGGIFDKYKEAKAKSGTGPQAQSSVRDSDLQNAMDRLEAAVQSLAAEQGNLKDLLKSVDSGAVSAALAKCKVTFVAKSLSLRPVLLDFVEKTAGSKPVVISGGTGPYTVTVLDVVSDNSVTVGFKETGSDIAYVTVASNVAAGDYSVMVRDSSTDRHMQILNVHVVAKPAAAPASGRTPARPAGSSSTTPVPKKPATSASAPTPPTHLIPATTPDTVPTGVAKPDAPASAAVPVATTETSVAQAWKKLAASLLTPGFNRQLQGVTIGVESATLTATGLRVFVRCDRPTGAIPPGQLRGVIASADPISVTQLRKAQALDASLTQIDAAATKSCFKD